jgi:hypothetical protein
LDRWIDDLTLSKPFKKFPINLSLHGNSVREKNSFDQQRQFDATNEKRILSYPLDSCGLFGCGDRI